jgi:CheY-like chemotaxis protein/HPt (histidine-containing phosphotransfer) domain-containing protein
VSGDGIPVLVAEDNEVNQQLAARMLERRGFRPAIVANGEAALRALATDDYALVLMDCQMPVMDGYEATRQLRRREGSGQHTPVIAMTAHSLSGDRERCLAAGMDDYLSKPLDADEFDAALQRWLQAAQTGIASHPPVSQPAQTITSAAVDVNTVERLREEIGAEQVARIVGLFLQSAPEQVAELREAVARRDAQEVRDTAHKLKGSAASLGAATMASLSQKLVDAARAGQIERAPAMVSELERSLQETRAGFERAAMAPGPDGTCLRQR